MRPIPQAAVTLVAAHENLRLKAYQDVAGVWTNGFGHTEGVKIGDRCTRQQAAVWLDDDLQAARIKLYGVLKPAAIDSLTDSQWSALLSFAFNLGAKSGWTIWKRINAGHLDQAPVEMMRFVNVRGQRNAGLVNRRADEAKLWSQDEPGTAREAPPSSVTRRAGETPPMPADPVPAGRSAALLVSTAGVVASSAPMVDAAQRAIAPYAEHSTLVARMLGLLATIGAGLAMAGLLLVWLKHREARS